MNRSIPEDVLRLPNPPPENPVIVALQNAMLATASSLKPSELDFQTEIDQRLLWAKGLALLLADAANATAAYQADFDQDGLHAAAVMLHNEIQTVGYLHDALQHCLNEGVVR